MSPRLSILPFEMLQIIPDGKLTLILIVMDIVSFAVRVGCVLLSESAIYDEGLVIR